QALNQPLFLLIFFITLLVMNGIGATQDIATDGLAVNILKNEQQHWGNTFQVIGSRLGFIIGGGAILWLLDFLHWQMTFLLLAALVFLNTLPVLWFKEPNHQKIVSSSSEKLPARTRIKAYFQYFLADSTLATWLLVLLTFKVADGLSGPLLKPLMVDLGLSFSQIGIYVTMLGAFAALIGAGLAGWCLKYWSRSWSLLIFSVLKIMTLMAYAWLAAQYEIQNKVENWIIYLINAAEDMVSAMLLVVMLTLVMQYSRKHLAGTDFTFQVALMATVSGGLYSLSGILGDYWGYAQYLTYIVWISVFLLWPIVFWGRTQQDS
ncbi:MFS transporter, partial [Acinetobacter variabilis]|uniref:MFS transporter n=1 Tax=Acinetobacter variabilis TaxID=70346 RepID=UPI0028B06750